MDILVAVHVGEGCSGNGVNCALISLCDDSIKQLHKMAKRAGSQSSNDYPPELGKTELELEEFREMTELKSSLSAMVGSNEIFTALHDVRVECVQVHVDSTHFWWEGVFKHTDVHWETRMIPLSILPAIQSGKPARQPQVSDSITETQINSVLEKVAQGMAHGLNSKEIEATFNRHITKAHLVQCISYLIQKGTDDGK
jgi:hypothetical protein